MKPLRSSYPKTCLLNSAFKYRRSWETDVTITWRTALLREQRQQYVADAEHHARLTDLVRVD